MTLHLFLTLTLAVACVVLAWGWWNAHRMLRATEVVLSALMKGKIADGVLVTHAKIQDNAVTHATIADGAEKDGVIVHFPSWMDRPEPGPQIDHLGRELP